MFFFLNYTRLFNIFSRSVFHYKLHGDDRTSFYVASFPLQRQTRTACSVRGGAVCVCDVLRVVGSELPCDNLFKLT